MDLRPIETESYARIDAPSSLGRPPRLEWIAIRQLVVDPEYQRDITFQGRGNVRRIGAARIRLYRDTDGNPHAEEAIESKPLDPRHTAREGASAPEGESSFPASPRARGLSKEAIARIVERAEASAKEKVSEASAHEKRLRDADAIDAKRAKAAEPASA